MKRKRPTVCRSTRRGNVVLMAAGMMVMIFGFAAFSIDVGYIALTKTQLQAAADSGAMAAATEFTPGLGLGATKSPLEVETSAEAAAVDLVGRHEAGGQDSIYLDGNRDVRLGQVSYNTSTGTWTKTWGAAPYNLVEVTVRRDQQMGSADGPLPLFFAPVIGHDRAHLTTRASAGLLPAIGFSVKAGSTLTCPILPFALDLETWDNLADHNIGEQDEHTCTEDGVVSNQGDTVMEVNLYPHGKSNLPPGNRGTVDIGANSNSTADLKRQILYGLNDFDLSFFPDGIKASPAAPLDLQGDTGISAGFKAQLEMIKGQPRAIPIFKDKPTGNGNNAVYTIVKFVGVRIVDVKLTGNPKRLMIQPGPVSDPTAVRDTTGTVSFEDGLFTTPVILE